MTFKVRCKNSRQFPADTALLAFLFWICGWLPVLPPDSAFGQVPLAPAGPNQAPTATAAQPAAQALPVPPPDSSLPESSQLIIRAVQNSNPQTPVDVASALQTMFNIEQFDHALYYLSRLQTTGLTPVQLFEIHEKLGTDFLLELNAQPEMQPAGKQFARRVLAAAKSHAAQPQRLTELVKRLSDNDHSVRSQSFRQLRRLGPAATVEMLQTFTDPTRESEFAHVRAALGVMGPDAVPPLVAATRAGNLQMQIEAARALSNYESPAATDALLRCYLSPHSLDSLRQVARSALTIKHQVPSDPAQVEEKFYQKARDLLTQRRTDNSRIDGKTTVWNWDEKAGRLVPTTLPVATASRILAAQYATDVYEIRPDKPRNRDLYLLTQLEAAKRIVGPDKTVSTREMKGRFPDLTTGDIQSVLRQAIHLKLIPAAIACCEILGEIGTPELLHGSSHQPCPLVEAMLIGDRHLQFAAFNAIDKLDPKIAYPGSSYTLLLAVYLAGSDGRAGGLVGYNRQDLAQSYAATMQTAGLDGHSANSAQEFFDKATSDPDLDVLLVSDTLSRPDYAELIQQLRNDMRTKRLPIGLLVRDTQHSLRVRRLIGSDPFFIAMPFTIEPVYVASQIKRLQALADPWPVTELQRRQYAQVAINWLARIASQHDQYRYYNLGAHQDQLTQLLYLPGFAEPASQILVNLGTPAAQRELVNFANQNGLPVEARQTVVAAFSKAVNQGGTLLTRAEILQQYERYNASAAEPESSQKILGSILDVIESNAE